LIFESLLLESVLLNSLLGALEERLRGDVVVDHYLVLVVHLVQLDLLLLVLVEEVAAVFH